MLLIPIAIFIVCIVVMQQNTDDLMKEIKDAFYCTDIYIDEATYNKDPSLYIDSDFTYIVYQRNTLIPNIYAHYNYTGQAIERTRSKEVKTEIQLKRIFVLHNFSHGTLWIKYSVSITDYSNNPIIGSWDIPVKMSIQKIDGVWKVTDLYEVL